MLLVILFLFVFGLAIGSFLNVVIYRSLSNESPFEGRSKCPKCGKQIAWYDNIPLLSYIVLRGKCRHCHGSIALTYPVIELLTGALFVWWYLGGFFFFQLTQQPFHYIQPLFWLIVAIFLLIIFVTDAISFIIPDYAVWLLAGVAFIYRLALTLTGIMQLNDFLLSLFAMVLITLFFFSLWWYTDGKGMGFGDVKFAVPMSLLLGWPNIFVGVFLSFFCGAIVGIFLMLYRRKTMKDPVPFGPFLVTGTVVALVYGKQLLQWYLGML